MDVVLTSLPTIKEIEVILNSPNGVYNKAKKGIPIIDTSTILPSDSERLNKESKEKGFIFIEAPASGGVIASKAGTLTFMLGCDEEYKESISELLLKMGSRVYHCGGPGYGARAKVCNNLILAIQNIASCEGLAMGKKLGLDQKLLTQIISHSTGRNWCVDTYNPVPGIFPDAPASDNYDHGFWINLMNKDLKLALDAGKSVDASLELGKFS